MHPKNDSDSNAAAADRMLCVELSRALGARDKFCLEVTVLGINNETAPCTGCGATIGQSMKCCLCSYSLL